MRNKILAVVKFNDGEASVLKFEPKLKYTKYNNNIIIGSDGCFLQCYYYEKPTRPIDPNWSGWQAFGGREFDLQLTDGTTEHCYGQWWSGGYEKAEKILNCDIVSVTAKSKKGLINCYVFCGYTGIKKKIEKLRKRYRGKVYGYWEYEAILKGCSTVRSINELKEEGGKK